MNEKTLWNNDAQIIFRARHRDIEQATLLLQFLSGASAKVGWNAAVDDIEDKVLVRSYPLPQGYSVAVADIAIEVPVSYPGAQLDMFYCHPHLALANAQAIPQVQCTESVTGIGFQRWSRHRQWDSARDNVGTHLALVDESLRREVER